MLCSSAAVAVGLLFLLLGLVCLILPLGVHFGFRAPRVPKVSTPADRGLSYEQVRLPTVRRRWLSAWLLPARLQAPAANSGWRAQCTILMLHGWGSNSEQILPLAVPLVGAGFNVLLLDARNHGSSDGDTFSSLPRFAEDLEQGIRWLKHHQPARARSLAVIGHSVGAGAVLLAATRTPAIDAAISLSAFAHPQEVTARFLEHLPLPRALVSLVARYVEWLIGYRFDAIAPINTIRRVPCPVLLMHGTADRTVPLSDAERIYDNRLSDRVRLILVPDADHGSTDRIEQHADGLLRFLADSLAPGGVTLESEARSRLPATGTGSPADCSDPSGVNP
ncbi:MAG: alpha/beta fold hydrolase [Gammaproteobacteria bacterium]|jgi:pimeloyl-ACP methyl ester carboxylesterase|nr:alpha/beta fold hydrolase [Gammaproteobacteria bacterium]